MMTEKTFVKDEVIKSLDTCTTVQWRLLVSMLTDRIIVTGSVGRNGMTGDYSLSMLGVSCTTVAKSCIELGFIYYFNGTFVMRSYVHDYVNRYKPKEY